MKRDQQLEDLRAERDYWRKLAHERGEQAQRLAQDLEAQGIHVQALVSGAGGAAGAYDDQIRRLISERDALAAELDALRPPRRSDAPVHLLAYFRDEAGSVNRVDFDLNWPGDWEGFKANFLPAVLFATSGVDWDDLSGGLPGLAPAELWLTASALVGITERDPYLAARGKAFYRAWPAIEAEHKRLGLLPDRRELRDRFNKIADRTVQKARERQGRFTVTEKSAGHLDITPREKKVQTKFVGTKS